MNDFAKSGARALIVDDQPLILLSLKARLERIGYDEVDAAYNGEAAWEKVNGHHYDLIISDIQMPVMNGMTFFGQVAEDPRFSDIPFIFMSGTYMKPPVTGRTTFFLKKPFLEDELEDMIATVHASRSLRKFA